MAEDKESKTEEPTDKKKREARKEGQIARSQDLVAWTSILAVVFILETTVKRSSKFLSETMSKLGEEVADPDINTALDFAATSIKDALLAIAPLIAAMVVLAIIGHMAQVRFVLATKSMKPSFKKMNPITGLKRMFGTQGLFNVAKELVKVIILASVAYLTLYETVVSIGKNGPYDLHELIGVAGTACLSFVKFAAGAAVLVGIADYVFQYRKIKKSLRMSKYEIKQESKQQEVSPEIKGKLRQKQMAMSRNRMMAAVADADAVIVNPVHIAVAIQYDVSKGAPRVLAKGAGFVAEKIRERAEEEKIPTIQDIPLARVLHHSCEVGDEIPTELFEAVAKLLAFVFSLKKRSGGAEGFHKMPGTPDLDEMERNDVVERANTRFGGMELPESVG